MFVYQLAFFLLGVWVDTLQSFKLIAPPFLNLDPMGIFGGGADIICGAIGFDGAIVGPEGGGALPIGLPAS
jgi:hypothetical protein